MKRGPFEVISSQDVYKNAWIRVHEDKIIRPNGEHGVYGIIEYSPGVAIVAINTNNEVYLVKEYTYAIDEYNTSLPSGGVEKNETPLEAAKRELLEEAGVSATEWIELGYVNPFTTLVNGPEYLFLAKNAQIISSHEEEFELIIVPFEEACSMAMESKINHSGSCVALLKAKEYLQTK